MQTERAWQTERAAVEPVAALIALVAVGLALGLYTVALSDAEPEQENGSATTVLERIERESSVGGIVHPDRLDIPTDGSQMGVAVELRTRSETWRLRSGSDPPSLRGGDTARETAVAERAVTVRVGPGRNVPGTLRVVVRG
ncbi:DUF7285 family protein [Halorubrum vacuolatum]|uniref:DUF7285 family protein n=1 Tax=Halorubrum vacuolatum TaxID=63740 RepID=UPI000B76C202|nr:hypothetical protein [Halorubrum vacuolatum]